MTTRENRIDDGVGWTDVNAPSPRTRSHSISVALFMTSVALAVWALALWATGGFVIEVGAIHIASRRPRNPAVLALVLALLSMRAWPRLWRDSTDVRQRLWRRLDVALDTIDRAISTLSPAIGALAALGITAAAIVRGAFVAGGADSYGYVSQARMWRAWELFMPQPLSHEMTWSFTGRILAPLGYLPSPSYSDMSVPTYSPGLPMVMALFELVGGEQAIFYVVPLLAGTVVASTYLIGSRLAGRPAGAWAALLLATSPAFLFQAMFPMSDLPAAAWWTLSLAVLPFSAPWAAAVSGVSAGAAILTRPNLVPLAIVPGCWFLRELWTARRTRNAAITRLLLFAAGVIAASATVGAVNKMWYGAATQSGYGSLREYYDFGYLWTNIRQFSAWLIDSQTGVVAVALLAPAVILLGRPFRDRSWAEPRAYAMTLVWFVVAVAVSYLFYTPYDAWWYLRFLLPAFPALFVLIALTTNWLMGILPPSARVPVATALVALVAWRNVGFATDKGVWGFRDGERKYVVVGEYVGHRLPPEAVVMAVQHSGSVRYYGGRQTVRFDWIPPPAFDTVLANLVAHGHKPYLVLEKFEEPSFRDLFGQHTALGALGWSPVARTNDSNAIAIYDLVDRRTDRTPEEIR